MAKKRKTSAASRASSVKLKSRRAPRRVGRKAVSLSVSRVLLPLVISAVFLACVVFLGLSGYGTATASDFFELRSIDVRGAGRTSPDDIRRIVTAAVERPGVWNADLADIRTKVEKFPFVKSAAVSRVLPAGIRVNVIERIPAAVIHLTSGNYLVDGEGAILATVKTTEADFPFVLRGWDETKTERAVPDNLARLKVYSRMLDEWRQFDLASRVKEVDLSNPREPIAVVEDSGRLIDITLARDSLGKSLRTAVDAVNGKGAKIKSVNSGGVYPVIQFLEF